MSVVVADGLVGSFGLGVCAEVFGYDRRAHGAAAVRLRAGQPRRRACCAPTPASRSRWSTASTGWPAPTSSRSPPGSCSTASRRPALLDAFRAAHARGATIVSHCTGAFVLAAAGLLDGMRVTTHWKYAGELAARFPAVAGRPVGALRRQRAGHHRRGDGGRRRHPAAPGAPRVGRRRGQRAGPRDGRAAAPRRRAGPVHRRARARLPGRPARRRPGVGRRAPRRGHQRGVAGAPGADEPAELRPPVQGHHRDDAARLAARSAAGRRRGAARGERRPGRGDRPAGRASAPRPACASSSAAAAGSRRAPTGRRSGPARGQARGAAPVQLDGHRAGRVGSDQALVEAEFGQPA